MKKIFVIYHGRFPGEKAAALFAAKEADSFTPYAEVTLLVPRRVLRERSDPHVYYGISKKVCIRYLPVFDPVRVPGLKRIAFHMSYATFALSCAIFLTWRGRGAGVITNEPLPALFSTFVSTKVIFEVHDFPEAHAFFYSALFARVRIVLCTNAWKLQEISKRYSVPTEKLILERNAVDVEAFGAISKTEARNKLALENEKTLAVYTGHLYEHKGVETLLDAAAILPDVHFMLVGGTAHDRDRLAGRAVSVANITLVGQRPHAEIPLWQAAADVLLLPNSAKEELSSRYTSPMKLFEYMASGRPVVASRVPSITEIVTDKEAYLVEPDDADALAKGVRGALDDPQEKIRSERARERVLEHSWDARAARFLAQID